MRIEHDSKHNVFNAYINDTDQIGEIEYSFRADGTIEANHTWTDPKYRGHGVAGKLLDALVEFAVAKGAAIIPICPYVDEQFRTHPARYSAVMKK